MPETDLNAEMLYTKQDMIYFAALAVDECVSESDVEKLYNTIYETEEQS
ncbi:MAG: hypothetical protein ACOYN4_11210 [Bacteroidales bacterium]